MVRVYRHFAQIHPKLASLHTNLSDRASSAPTPGCSSGIDLVIKPRDGLKNSNNVIFRLRVSGWVRNWKFNSNFNFLKPSL